MDPGNISSGAIIEEQAAARAESFARDGWIFLGLASAITLLRMYSRWRTVGFKRFQADDFLVMLALGLYTGDTFVDIKLLRDFKALANDFTDNEERTTLSPDSEEYQLRVGASKYRLAEWIMYALLLWSLKAAMAVFYMRLTESLDGYRERIIMFFGFMLTTFTIVVVMPFLTCMPIDKMWQINPDPGRLCYPESSPAILWTILACNIVTDAFLLWIPMPMLFHASLPRTSKIALGCLFGMGIFVTAAATLRITLVATQVHNFHAIGFWSVRETFVAIATTNAPAIFVLARRWLVRRGVVPPPQTPSAKKTRAGGGGGSGPVRDRASWVVGKASPLGSRSEEYSMYEVGTGASVASSREHLVVAAPAGGVARDDAGGGGVVRSESRWGSLGRSGGARQGVSAAPAGGIRKQVDIVMVEEALTELGAHPRSNRFSLQRDPGSQV